MPPLKSNFWVSCLIYRNIEWSLFSPFVIKSENLINVICNWNILVFSSNTTFIVLPTCRICLVLNKKFLLKWSGKSRGISSSCLSSNPVDGCYVLNCSVFHRTTVIKQYWEAWRWMRKLLCFCSCLYVFSNFFHVQIYLPLGREKAS